MDTGTEIGDSNLSNSSHAHRHNISQTTINTTWTCVTEEGTDSTKTAAVTAPHASTNNNTTNRNNHLKLQRGGGRVKSVAAAVAGELKRPRVRDNVRVRDRNQIKRRRKI